MWQKYPSIENFYKQEFIEKCRILLKQHKGITFYVTEKIHGCNISFYFNKDNYNYADIFSRNQKIEDWDSQGLRKALYDNDILNHLRDIIRKHFITAKEVIFYGEYFGGVYNGKSEGTKIQNIEYCAKNKIVFFDINIDGEFIDFSKVIDVFDNKTLLPPIIRRNLTFDEALNENNRYETLVPILLNCKEKEHESICEGNIIRPSKELKIGMHRFIIKNKNETHSDCKISKHVSNVSISDLNEIDKYVTTARIESAVSKLQFHNIEFKILVNEIINDILSDYMKDNHINEIEKEKLKIFKKHIGKVVHKIYHINK